MELKDPSSDPEQYELDLAEACIAADEVDYNMTEAEREKFIADFMRKQGWLDCEE